MTEKSEVDVSKECTKKLLDIIFTEEAVASDIAGYWFRYKQTESDSVSDTIKFIFKVILHEPIDISIHGNLKKQIDGGYSENACNLYIFGPKYKALAIPFCRLSPEAVACIHVLVQLDKTAFDYVQSSSLEGNIVIKNFKYEQTVSKENRILLLKSMCTAILTTVKGSKNPYSFYNARDILTTTMSTLFASEKEACSTLGVQTHRFIHSLDIDSPHLNRKQSLYH